MSPTVLFLFAFFAITFGQTFNSPPTYSPSPSPLNFQDILTEIPSSSGNLEELAQSFRNLGEITGGFRFDGINGIDFSNLPDTLPFPFEPSTPGLPPPALGGAAQAILANFVPSIQGPPEEIINNVPTEFQQFSRFAGGNSGSTKGSFETVGKEILKLNVLDDILSDN